MKFLADILFRIKDVQVVVIDLNRSLNDALDFDVFQFKVAQQSFTLLPGQEKKLNPSIKDILICVKGSQVLDIHSKDLETNSNSSVLKQWLPQANLDEMLIQESDRIGTHVSCASEALIAQLIERQEFLNFSILSLSLGLTHALALLKEQGSEGNGLIGGQGRYLKSNNEIILGESEQDLSSFELEGIELNEVKAVAYGALLAFLSGDSPIQSPFLQKKITKAQELKNNKALLTVGLGVLFVLMFVNYLVFSNTQKQKMNLTSKNASALILKDQVESKQDQLSMRNRLLGNAGQFRPERTSYLVDQAISVLPEGVRLKELNVHPIEKKIRKEEPVQATREKVSFSGEAESGKDVYEWVASLKGIQGLRGVELVHFEENRERSNDFELKVDLSP